MGVHKQQYLEYLSDEVQLHPEFYMEQERPAHAQQQYESCKTTTLLDRLRQWWELQVIDVKAAIIWFDERWHPAPPVVYNNLTPEQRVENTSKWIAKQIDKSKTLEHCYGCRVLVSQMYGLYGYTPQVVAAVGSLHLRCYNLECEILDSMKKL